MKKKRDLIITAIFGILFLLGLSVMLYPTFANWWNQRHQTKAIAQYKEAVANMDDSETQKLLDEANDYNAKLAKLHAPFTNFGSIPGYEDILNISGTGMDTKVIGRIRIFGQKEPENPNFSRIGVLRLSEASHGNAIGIGLADFAPMGMLEKINIRATAINGWSSMCAEQGSLPCFVDTDREVFEQCIQTIGLDDPSKARIVFIQDTNTLSRIAVSETLYEAESEDLKEEELKNNPSLEKIGEPFDLRFDEDGRLLTVWKDGKLQF